MGAYEEIIAEQRAAQQRELETARKRAADLTSDKGIKLT